MKREIRDKRNELREESKRLKELAWSSEFGEGQNTFEIRERQNDRFNRFKFFDGMIKASDKVRKFEK